MSEIALRDGLGDAGAFGQGAGDAPHGRDTDQHCQHDLEDPQGDDDVHGHAACLLRFGMSESGSLLVVAQDFPKRLQGMDAAWNQLIKVCGKDILCPAGHGGF